MAKIIDWSAHVSYISIIIGILIVSCSANELEIEATEDEPRLKSEPTILLYPVDDETLDDNHKIKRCWEPRLYEREKLMVSPETDEKLWNGRFFLNNDGSKRFSTGSSEQTETDYSKTNANNLILNKIREHLNSEDYSVFALLGKKSDRSKTQRYNKYRSYCRQPRCFGRNCERTIYKPCSRLDNKRSDFNEPVRNQGSAATSYEQTRENNYLTPLNIRYTGNGKTFGQHNNDVRVRQGQNAMPEYLNLGIPIESGSVEDTTNLKASHTLNGADSKLEGTQWQMHAMQHKTNNEFLEPKKENGLGLNSFVNYNSKADESEMNYGPTIESVTESIGHFKATLQSPEITEDALQRNKLTPQISNNFFHNVEGIYGNGYISHEDSAREYITTAVPEPTIPMIYQTPASLESSTMKYLRYREGKPHIVFDERLEAISNHPQTERYSENSHNRQGLYDDGVSLETGPYFGHQVEYNPGKQLYLQRNPFVVEKRPSYRKLERQDSKSYAIVDEDMTTTTDYMLSNGKNTHHPDNAVAFDVSGENHWSTTSRLDRNYDYDGLKLLANSREYFTSDENNDKSDSYSTDVHRMSAESVARKSSALSKNYSNEPGYVGSNHVENSLERPPIPENTKRVVKMYGSSIKPLTMSDEKFSYAGMQNTPTSSTNYEPSGERVSDEDIELATQQHSPNGPSIDAGGSRSKIIIPSAQDLHVSGKVDDRRILTPIIEIDKTPNYPFGLEKHKDFGAAQKNNEVSEREFMKEKSSTLDDESYHLPIQQTGQLHNAGRTVSPEYPTLKQRGDSWNNGDYSDIKEVTNSWFTATTYDKFDPTNYPSMPTGTAIGTESESREIFDQGTDPINHPHPSDNFQYVFTAPASVSPLISSAKIIEHGSEIKSDSRRPTIPYESKSVLLLGKSLENVHHIQNDYKLNPILDNLKTSTTYVQSIEQSTKNINYPKTISTNSDEEERRVDQLDGVKQFHVPKSAKPADYIQSSEVDRARISVVEQKVMQNGNVIRKDIVQYPVPVHKYVDDVNSEEIQYEQSLESKEMSDTEEHWSSGSLTSRVPVSFDSKKNIELPVKELLHANESEDISQSTINSETDQIQSYSLSESTESGVQKSKKVYGNLDSSNENDRSFEQLVPQTPQLAVKSEENIFVNLRPVVGSAIEKNTEIHLNKHENHLPIHLPVSKEESHTASSKVHIPGMTSEHETEFPITKASTVDNGLLKDILINDLVNPALQYAESDTEPVHEVQLGSHESEVSTARIEYANALDNNHRSSHDKLVAPILHSLTSIEMTSQGSEDIVATHVSSDIHSSEEYHQEILGTSYERHHTSSSIPKSAMESADDGMTVQQTHIENGSVEKISANNIANSVVQSAEPDTERVQQSSQLESPEIVAIRKELVQLLSRNGPISVGNSVTRSDPVASETEFWHLKDIDDKVAENFHSDSRNLEEYGSIESTVPYEEAYNAESSVEHKFTISNDKSVESHNIKVVSTKNKVFKQYPLLTTEALPGTYVSENFIPEDLTKEQFRQIGANTGMLNGNIDTINRWSNNNFNTNIPTSKKQESLSSTKIVSDRFMGNYSERNPTDDYESDYRTKTFIKHDSVMPHRHSMELSDGEITLFDDESSVSSNNTETSIEPDRLILDETNIALTTATAHPMENVDLQGKSINYLPKIQLNRVAEHQKMESSMETQCPDFHSSTEEFAAKSLPVKPETTELFNSKEIIRSPSSESGNSKIIASYEDYYSTESSMERNPSVLNADQIGLDALDLKRINHNLFQTEEASEISLLKNTDSKSTASYEDYYSTESSSEYNPVVLNADNVELSSSSMRPANHELYHSKVSTGSSSLEQLDSRSTTSNENYYNAESAIGSKPLIPDCNQVRFSTLEMRPSNYNLLHSEQTTRDSALGNLDLKSTVSYKEFDSTETSTAGQPVAPDTNRARFSTSNCSITKPMDRKKTDHVSIDHSHLLAKPVSEPVLETKIFSSDVRSDSLGSSHVFLSPSSGELIEASSKVKSKTPEKDCVGMIGNPVLDISYTDTHESQNHQKMQIDSYEDDYYTDSSNEHTYEESSNVNINEMSDYKNHGIRTEQIESQESHLPTSILKGKESLYSEDIVRGSIIESTKSNTVRPKTLITDDENSSASYEDYYYSTEYSPVGSDNNKSEFPPVTSTFARNQHSKFNYRHSLEDSSLPSETSEVNRAQVHLTMERPESGVSPEKNYHNHLDSWNHRLSNDELITEPSDTVVGETKNKCSDVDVVLSSKSKNIEVNTKSFEDYGQATSSTSSADSHYVESSKVYTPRMGSRTKACSTELEREDKSLKQIFTDTLQLPLTNSYTTIRTKSEKPVRNNYYNDKNLSNRDKSSPENILRSSPQCSPCYPILNIQRSNESPNERKSSTHKNIDLIPLDKNVYAGGHSVRGNSNPKKYASTEEPSYENFSTERNSKIFEDNDRTIIDSEIMRKHDLASEKQIIQTFINGGTEEESKTVEVNDRMKDFLISQKVVENITKNSKSVEQLERTIRYVVKMFMRADTVLDHVTKSTHSSETVGSVSGYLLPLKIEAAILERLFNAPIVKEITTNMVRSILKGSGVFGHALSEQFSNNAIHTVLKQILQEFGNSSPNDRPIVVEEHKLRDGKWITENVTLKPRPSTKLRLPFEIEKMNKIISQMIVEILQEFDSSPKNRVAACNPVVQNVIVSVVKEYVKNQGFTEDVIENLNIRDLVTQTMDRMFTTKATDDKTLSLTDTAELLTSKRNENQESKDQVMKTVIRNSPKFDTDRADSVLLRKSEENVSQQTQALDVDYTDRTAATTYHDINTHSDQIMYAKNQKSNNDKISSSEESTNETFSYSDSTVSTEKQMQDEVVSQMKQVLAPCDKITHDSPNVGGVSHSGQTYHEKSSIVPEIMSEKVPIKYFSPNDRILEYIKTHTSDSGNEQGITGTQHLGSIEELSLTSNRHINVNYGSKQHENMPKISSKEVENYVTGTSDNSAKIHSNSHEILQPSVEDVSVSYRHVQEKFKHMKNEDCHEDTTSSKQCSQSSGNGNDIGYLGKLVPQESLATTFDATSANNPNNSEVYYIGDGVRIPLTIKKLADGSFALSLSDKICEKMLAHKCHCCMLREDKIVQDDRGISTSEEYTPQRYDSDPDKEWLKLHRTKRLGESESLDNIQKLASESGMEQGRTIRSTILPDETFTEEYNLNSDLERNSNRLGSSEKSDHNSITVRNPASLNSDVEVVKIGDNLNILRNDTTEESQNEDFTSELVRIREIPEEERANALISILEKVIATEPKDPLILKTGGEKQFENVEDENHEMEDAVYEYQRRNPILSRIEYIKAKQKELGMVECQHRYQKDCYTAITEKTEILKKILYWLEDLVRAKSAGTEN